MLVRVEAEVVDTVVILLELRRGRRGGHSTATSAIGGNSVSQGKLIGRVTALGLPPCTTLTGELNYSIFILETGTPTEQNGTAT